jgi:hypothetical protein
VVVWESLAILRIRRRDSSGCYRIGFINIGCAASAEPSAYDDALGASPLVEVEESEGHLGERSAELLDGGV